MAKKKAGGRASNGMGSIRQRADGRWEARYSTPDGKQRSVYGKTEKEVTAKLRGTLHDIDSGNWREPSKMTVGEWLDTWLRDYQGHTTGRTVLTYTGQVECYIRPVIGTIKMGSLKPTHCMKVLAGMQEKGLASQTQRSTVILLNSIMRAAIIAGIIKENPAENIKPPKVIQKKFLIIDRDKIPAFIEAAKKTDFPNELQLLLYTGLRVGELRGLLWSDFDETKKTLSVERQLYAHAKCKKFGQPKHGETRTIQLPDEAIAVLRDQRKRQSEQKFAAGQKWVDSELSTGLIFRQSMGQTHTNISLARAVKKVGAAIGLPELHPHDLRHSYAVAAIRAGADIKTVQHNMGHKSASVTLDTYADYTTDAGKVGAQKFSEYLQNVHK